MGVLYFPSWLAIKLTEWRNEMDAREYEQRMKLIAPEMAELQSKITGHRAQVKNAKDRIKVLKLEIARMQEAVIAGLKK